MLINLQLSTIFFKCQIEAENANPGRKIAFLYETELPLNLCVKSDVNFFSAIFAVEMCTDLNMKSLDVKY